MPVVQHASDSCGIVEIAEAILSQLEEIHEDRDEYDSAQCQLRPGRQVLICSLFYRMIRLSPNDCRCRISHSCLLLVFLSLSNDVLFGYRNCVWKMRARQEKERI